MLFSKEQLPKADAPISRRPSGRTTSVKLFAAKAASPMDFTRLANVTDVTHV